MSPVVMIGKFVRASRRHLGSFFFLGSRSFNLAFIIYRPAFITFTAKSCRIANFPCFLEAKL
jgi:hypothetical protein